MSEESDEDAKGNRMNSQRAVGGRSCVSLDEIPLDTPRNFLVSGFCCPNSVLDEDQHETYY